MVVSHMHGQVYRVEHTTSLSYFTLVINANRI